MTSTQKSCPKLPRDVIGNLEYRALLLAECDQDKAYRAKVNEMCRRDPIFWINSFCWTKDPKQPFKLIPFITYEEFQDGAITELVDAINTGYDEGIEKTREMGVSWIVLYVFTWFWLYWPNSDFLVGSRKEDVVDTRGDPSSLFEKIRICLGSLPTWMLPPGFSIEEDALTLRILNKANGNSIIGESANPFFGSGGRVKAALLDEFSKWDPLIAISAWTSMGDVTRCRMPVSTPLGSGNKFAELMQGTDVKIKKLTLHWTLHPIKSKGCYRLEPDGTRIPIDDSKEAFKQWEKNRDVVRVGLKGGIIRSPWYDAECERRTDSEIAQELDISFLKSGSPFFDMAKVNGQKKWTYIKRATPNDRIPWGSYIRGKIIEVDGKYSFIETDVDPWVNIFEMPLDYMTYVLSADTSEGLVKGDESAGFVRSRYTRHTMASLHGLWPPEDFAVKLFKLGKFYNDALDAAENNNHGYTVNRDLQMLGANLYFTKKEETPNGTVTTPKRGFTTGPANRNVMLDQMEEEIRKEVVELRDPKLIDQCKTFVRNPKTGKPEADGMFKDDTVLAFAIGGQVISENPYKPKSDAGSAARAEAQRRMGVKNGGFKF